MRRRRRPVAAATSAATSVVMPKPVLARVLAAVLAVAAAGGCTGTPDRGAAPEVVVSGLPEPGTEAGRSDPVGDPVYPEYGDPALDVLRYRLDLAWSPPKRELTGTATLTIRVVRPVREIALDFADSYTVDGVTVDGAAAEPGRRGND